MNCRQKNRNGKVHIDAIFEVQAVRYATVKVINAMHLSAECTVICFSL